MRQSSQGITKTRKRHVACIVLVTAMLFSSASACENEDTVTLPADYGSYGADRALELARLMPHRKAYSQQARAAGDWIEEQMTALGYEVESQTFPSATVGTSRNLVIRIPGEGMMVWDEASQSYVKEHRTVVVGAHYDVPVGIADADDYPGFDGIHGNASAIGALLTLAKEAKDLRFGYDVIIVAFGASADHFAGANVFLDRLQPDDIDAIDVMYCIEAIYAGDKLYASAGYNSLIPGQKYEMRRKLYEAYDVVYESTLSSSWGVDLLYNESDIRFDVDGDGRDDIFREVSLFESDYRPFDRQGIPIVFFESFDYNFTTLDAMKETRNLNLQQYDGMIRGTANDATDILANALDPDQLEIRINSTAYIIMYAIKKGSHTALSLEAYERGEQLDVAIVA